MEGRDHCSFFAHPVLVSPALAATTRLSLGCCRLFNGLVVSIKFLLKRCQIPIDFHCRRKESALNSGNDCTSSGWFRIDDSEEPRSLDPDDFRIFFPTAAIAVINGGLDNTALASCWLQHLLGKQIQTFGDQFGPAGKTGVE